MAYPTSIENASFFGVAYNNLSTTLSAEASASDTTIYVASTTNFTAPGWATCEDEVFSYTGKTAGSFTGCVRGADNTTAAIHASGKSVSLTFPAIMWTRVIAELRATMTALGIAGAFNFVEIDGWISTGTFTYASPTTITVTSGAPSIYQKGDKLRFKQTAGTYKYFYVVGVADTVLTVTGGSDYAVLNEAITVPAYSHVENPLGFPSMFNFAETYTGFSADPSSDCKFYISRGNCIYIVAYTGSGTSNAVGKTITAPITNAQGATVIGLGTALDNGAWLTAPCMAQLGNASATVTVDKAIFGVAWTASGGCGFGFVLIYKI